MLGINTSNTRSTSARYAALPLALFLFACSDAETTEQEAAAGDASSRAGAGRGGSGVGGDVDSAGGDTSAEGGTSNGGSSDAGAAGDATGSGEAQGPAPVQLGTAAEYAIVAKSAISNVPTSRVTGDLALSPAAATYVTGFALTRAGDSWSSAQVVGSVFAANGDPPTPTRLTTAIGDMQTAYTDAAGRPTPDFVDLEGGTIGGLTLSPGLYKWSSTVTIPTDITLEGKSGDVWILQISGDLKLSAAKRMILSGGAQPENVFWQVAGAVDLGTTSHAEGIVLSKTAIKLQTGSSINGRLLAQTAVNLAKATVTAP